MIIYACFYVSNIHFFHISLIIKEQACKCTFSSAVYRIHVFIGENFISKMCFILKHTFEFHLSLFGLCFVFEFIKEELRLKVNVFQNVVKEVDHWQLYYMFKSKSMHG